MRPVSLSQPTQPESLLSLRARAWCWPTVRREPGHRVTRLLAVRLSSYTIRSFENRDTFDVRIIEPVSIYVVALTSSIVVFVKLNLGSVGWLVFELISITPGPWSLHDEFKATQFCQCDVSIHTVIHPITSGLDYGTEADRVREFTHRAV